MKKQQPYQAGGSPSSAGWAAFSVVSSACSACTFSSSPVCSRNSSPRHPSRHPTGAAGGKCADGGNSGRWTEADFGPEQTELRFVYLGSAPEAEAARGKEQHYPIPPQWTSTNSSCIAVTVHLDLNGWQAKPPTLDALYRLVDGRCQ